MSTPSIVPQQDVISILPSAAAVGDWQLYLLGALYISAALFAGATIVVHKYYYHQIRVFSFKTTFLAMSFVFMAFRAVTSLASFSWVLFWLMFCSTILPMLLQFTIFSLLILFLARRLLIVQGKEHHLKRRLYPIYGVIIALIWIGSIILCYFMSTDTAGPFERDSFDVQTSIYASLGFGFTVTLQGVYAYKTYRVLSSIALTEKRRYQVHRYMVIISLYLCIFIARTLWNLTNYLHVNRLQDLFYSLQQRGSNTCWTIYICFYILLEILPIGIITFLLSWMSFAGSGAAPSERKPILRPNGSRGSLLASSGSLQSENINTSAIGGFADSERPSGAIASAEVSASARSQGSSITAEERNYGQSITITSPIRLDPRDFVDSEPSSLASSLGTSWGGLVRDSDAESGEEDPEEDEENQGGSFRDYSKLIDNHQNENNYGNDVIP